jgi:hypothetical protein
MKISKALLQSIAVGLAIGTASSCALLGDEVIPKKTNDDSTEQTCEEKTNEGVKGNHYDNCPACGMG